MTNKETVLLAMYEEQCAHGRHHESQRTNMSNVLVGVYLAAASVLSFSEGITPHDIPLILLLIVLGLFGALFSIKFNERFRFHMARARMIRKELDALTAAGISGLLKEAKRKHLESREHYPVGMGISLTKWWVTLHLLVSFFGGGLLLYLVYGVLKPYWAA